MFLRLFAAESILEAKLEAAAISFYEIAVPGLLSSAFMCGFEQLSIASAVFMANFW